MKDEMMKRAIGHAKGSEIAHNKMLDILQDGQKIDNLGSIAVALTCMNRSLLAIAEALNNIATEIPKRNQRWVQRPKNSQTHK